MLKVVHKQPVSCIVLRVHRIPGEEEVAILMVADRQLVISSELCLSWVSRMEATATLMVAGRWLPVSPAVLRASQVPEEGVAVVPILADCVQLAILSELCMSRVSGERDAQSLTLADLEQPVSVAVLSIILGPGE